MVQKTEQWELVFASGKDAARLLEGQLTCSVADLPLNDPQLMAICNVQGRVIVSGFVHREEEGYGLWVPAGEGKHALAVLEKYGVFFQVELVLLAVETKQAVFALLAPKHEQCVARGWVCVTGAVAEQWTPGDLDYITLGAVSLDKGCYIGQEIIARMHYRGQSKNRLVWFHCKPDRVVPVGGVLCSDDEAGGHIKAGQVLSSYEEMPGQCRGLAIVKKQVIENEQSLVFVSSEAVVPIEYAIT